MIIVQQKINLKKTLKMLIIILTVIVILIVGILAIVMMLNKMKVEKMCHISLNEEEIELRTLEWWENAVVYQVYLRSFKDSDGDGIGDIKGLTSKLEHFVDAGIDVIWLSPIFTSPMVDFGYDVSNFYDIHYEYGTMDDFEDTIEKAHRLGIKVLLDYVPNHASIDSEYFKLSERKIPGYENYFVWADPRPDPENNSNRLLPSNWISEFGGSIWEWNEIRQQYYLHQFAKTQADFNFREPAVRKELINILKFWLQKGADGFRLDALPHFFEASADDKGFFPDEPLSGNLFVSPFEIGYTNRMYTKDLNEVYKVVYEWREFIDEWQVKTNTSTKLLLAEAYTNISNTMLYYGDETNKSGVHFPFNFDFIRQLSYTSGARDFVYVVNHWLVYMPHGRVANWVLGNHDNSRMATRFSPAMVDGLNALTMMLPGVACTYQGDEIGMEDGHVPWKDTIDIRALRLGNADNYTKYTSDPSRTPFLWDGTKSAGFSTNQSTWLPVSKDYKTNNLEEQNKSERSHYKMYQFLTALRKKPALSHGAYHIQAISKNTLVLVRYLYSDGYALVFNVGKEYDTVDLRREPLLKEPMVLHMCSVHSKRRIGDEISLGSLTLQPGEALVLSIKINRI